MEVNLLVISGQMLSGVLLSAHSQLLSNTLLQLLGVGLILLGLYWAQVHREH